MATNQIMPNNVSEGLLVSQVVLINKAMPTNSSSGGILEDHVNLLHKFLRRSVDS